MSMGTLKKRLVGSALLIIAILALGAAVSLMRDPYCNALGYGFWDCLRFVVNAGTR